MRSGEGSPLAYFDTKIERTLLRRRESGSKKTEAITKEMGDKKLRDRDQVLASDMVMPVIQANYFELKPALINMV
jgi:hypothetical protein